jgi:LmbE family N-acetylglucosaminyl deacetylase
MPEYSITSDHPRILGIFAHPDDEVFCAGGMLAHCTAASAEVLVVSATKGQAGQIRDPRAATRRTLGAVRARELEEACTRLGVGQAYCLDYLDGTLRDVESDRLASDVAAIIQDFSPDTVITFGPDGGYGHPDHVAISAATTRAWAGIANSSQQITLYYSHFPRRNLLLAERLAGWLVARGTRFQGSEEFAHSLALVAEGATMLGFARDTLRVQWFPAGFSIVEQDELGTSLYLILSGSVEVIQEEVDGTRRVLRRLEVGQFFGELSLAHGRPRSASVVATEGVTCLVLSAETPTAFAGRGAGARLAGATLGGDGEGQDLAETICIDVANRLEQKLAALAAHRTQYPIMVQQFPPALLHDLFGRECFVPVPVPTVSAAAIPGRRVRGTSHGGAFTNRRRSHRGLDQQCVPPIAHDLEGLTKPRVSPRSGHTTSSGPTRTASARWPL